MSEVLREGLKRITPFMETKLLCSQIRALSPYINEDEELYTLTPLTYVEPS
jgi:hypothetical protein